MTAAIADFSKQQETFSQLSSAMMTVGISAAMKANYDPFASNYNQDIGVGKVTAEDYDAKPFRLGSKDITPTGNAVAGDVAGNAKTVPVVQSVAVTSAKVDHWGNADDLVDVATVSGKGGVTPVGRAFQKHVGNTQRAGSFAGEVTGSAVKNTEQGLDYLYGVLENTNSTYVVRNTKAFGEVLDVRLPNGIGARWSADGKIFIGFLERYTFTK